MAQVRLYIIHNSYSLFHGLSLCSCSVPCFISLIILGVVSLFHRVLFTEKGRGKFTGKLNGIKLLFMSTLYRLDGAPGSGWREMLAALLVVAALSPLTFNRTSYFLLTVAALPPSRPPGDGRNMFSIEARIVSFSESGQDRTGLVVTTQTNRLAMQ